jgi:hypothetical protein
MARVRQPIVRQAYPRGYVNFIIAFRKAIPRTAPRLQGPWRDRDDQQCRSHADVLRLPISHGGHNNALGEVAAPQRNGRPLGRPPHV